MFLWRTFYNKFGGKIALDRQEYRISNDFERSAILAKAESKTQLQFSKEQHYVNTHNDRFYNPSE